VGARPPGAHGRREPNDLPPLLEALGADLLILVSGEEVAAEAEGVADSAEGLQEPLRVLR